MLKLNSLYWGDCLNVMQRIDEKSIDLILTDLPYQKTELSWDTIIPLEPLWHQYERIIKDHGAIILTASQPFTSLLVSSNLSLFKYALVWNKTRCTNPILANTQPLQCHEDILIFYRNTPVYNPQFTKGKPYKAPATGSALRNNKIINGKDTDFKQQDNNGFRYPLSILDFPIHATSKLLPTQKPVALFEYLIRTYSNEGDIILDNTAGSGTTGIAAIRSQRKYILIEKSRRNFELAKNRIKNYKELVND
jgi:site-specific DNA-methyltransferase (adenine-specific)